MPRHHLTTVERLLARLTVAEADVQSALDAALRSEPEDIAVLCVVALLRSDAGHLDEADAVADARQDRQRVAVARCFLAGELDQGLLLAREHLSEFPADLVVSWAAARGGG